MKNKYPFSRQEGLKDCGAASLQMIIKYYGGYVSIEELNDMLGTTKNGTSAFEMIEVAKKLGFEAFGINLLLEDMEKSNIILPLIAYTTIDNKYNHFMVIYNINFKKKKIILADPQSCIKKMGFKEFKAIYNNVSLVFYPIKPIVRKNDVSMKDIVIELIKKYKNEVKFLIIFSLILIILSISSSFYMKILFDNFELSIKFLLIIFVFFLFLNIFKVIMNYLRTHLLIKISEKTSFELNNDACNKIIDLPYRYYKNKTTGEILSKIVDLEKMQDAINRLIIVTFADVPLAIFSIIVLSAINFKLFCISSIFLILYFLVFFIPKKYIVKKTEDYYISRSKYISFLEESISGFESIKNLNAENVISEKNERNYIECLKNITTIDNTINVQNAFKEIISYLYELIVAFVGIIFVKNGNITIGSLVAFNSIQIFFFTPIRNIIELDVSLIEAKKVIKKVYEMFENVKTKKNMIDNINKIEIIDFSYQNSNHKVLNKINLTINKGDKIMLMGRSGSGKSTLLKSLVGYFEVERNKIKYDDVDLNDICNIRNKITYVSQNESLFTDSLKNNIEIYNGDFNTIAKDFYIEEIAEKNSLGYNMVIEEDGFNISGGQKQRIVLARACMKSFEVLMIDEALNQVDINLERNILKNMFKRYKDKTIIVVSHRKNNIDLYDKVLEIKNGKIVGVK